MKQKSTTPKGSPGEFPAAEAPASDGHDILVSQPASGFTEIIGNRHFLVLWLAQALSQSAQNVANFALVVQTENVTKSSTQVSLIILSFIIPSIIFSAIAGVFVDRTSKKTVLLISNISRGIVVLAYIFIDYSWPLLYLMTTLNVITFVFSAISQFFGPAEAAMIPLLVKRRQLITANSMFNITFTAAQVIGFVVLGPVLTKVIGFQAVFLAVLALYWVCAILVSLLPPVEPSKRDRHPNGKPPDMWGELREGWNFIVHDKPVANAIIHLSTGSSLILVIGTLGPGFVTRVLGIQADDMAYLVAPAGIGVVLGIVLVPRFSTASNRQLMVNLAMTGIGATLLVLALVKPVAELLVGWLRLGSPLTEIVAAIGVLALVSGVLNAFLTVPAQTVMQERSPEAIRGRVFSAFFMIASAASIFPILFAGAIADVIGADQAFMLVGIVVLLVGAASLYLQYRSSPDHPTI